MGHRGLKWKRLSLDGLRGNGIRLGQSGLSCSGVEWNEVEFGWGVVAESGIAWSRMHGTMRREMLREDAME